ncbi:MAG: TolC family protein [Desulfomonilaceae bacterium]
MDRLRLFRKVFFIAVMAFAMNIPTSVSAADRSVRGGNAARREAQLSLPQAISIAVARNLRMADSRLAIAEKEHQRREAFSDFFPSIDIEYQAGTDKYRQQVQNNFLILLESNVQALSGIHPSRWVVRGNPLVNGLLPAYPYRIDPYRAFSISANITQPLFTGGKLLNNYKFAELGVDYSAIQSEVDRQDLILEVYEAYYQILQAIKLLGVANDAIRALEALRNQAMAFFKEGVNTKADVLAAEGQLAQAHLQQTQAMADIERAKATLNFLLRYPQETPLEIVEDLSYTTNPYRIPAIYATAAANRLEIRQANISVDQAMALVKSAKADVMPSLSVQVTAARFNDDWNVFDSEGNNDWSIQGLLTWSFDMFRTRETVKERRASEARAFVSREQVVEQVVEEVKLAYVAMKRSESDIQNNRKAVAFRRENFRVNQRSYEEQVATYIEVLDAQRQLSLSEGDYIMSLVGYLINRAVLERKMGILRQ